MEGETMQGYYNVKLKGVFQNWQRMARSENAPRRKLLSAMGIHGKAYAEKMAQT